MYTPTARKIAFYAALVLSNSIFAQAQAACPCTIWSSSTTPANAAASDSSAVELGVKFRASQSGSMTGVRFYKGSGNTGVHVGKVWSSTGALLASATFTGETATGWQQVSFASPIAVAANTTYIASYFAPSGHYAYNTNYFAVATDNPPLRALANGEDGGNGLYLYGAGGGFPTNAFNASNYWVDVAFANSGPNSPPVAVNDSYTTYQGQTLTVAAPGVLSNDTDADGNALNAIKVTNPANGTVTLNSNGSFTYTPNASFLGTDTFTYKANDGATDSNVATVSITVSSAPIPVAANDNYSINQGQSLTVAAPGVLSNDTSPGGLPLTAIKLTNPANGVVTLNANGSFTYTPNAAFTGSDSFTYKANNGLVDSNAATVSITVNVAPVPVAVNDLYSGTQGQALTIAAPGVLANDSSPGGPLTAIKVTNPSNGTVTLNADGSFTYTPNAGFAGTDSFTYKANNGSADSNVATVTICPCLIWNSSTVPGTKAASDSSAVELGVKFRVTQNGLIAGVRFYKGTGNTGTHVGKLWSSTGTLLASATFTGETATGWQQVSFASPIAVAVNTTYVASYFAPNGHYATNASYFASAVSNPPLRGLANGEDGGNGLYLYGAGGGFPNNTFNSSNYWVDIVFVSSGSYSPPVAVNDTYTTHQGQALTVAAPGVLSNDTAANANPLTAIKVTNPANGTVTLNSNGSFIYTPNASFLGTDTFTYKANDGVADSNVATVSITVSSVPIPVAANDNYSTNQGQSLTVAAPGVLSNDTSPGGLPLTAIKLTNPANGVVTLNANGSFTYTPNAGFSGTDSFTYKANNGTTDSNVATVTITVNASTSCPCTIWTSSTVPGTPSAADGSSVEVGVKFQASQAGYITGLRFYKGPANPGTHIGNLWSRTGTLLASATFSNEGTTGWQQVDFAPPVSIVANTTYVASYFAPSGGYAADTAYFVSGVTRGLLHALADGEDGSNGVYIYGSRSAFPNASFRSANYWVDVVFSTTITTYPPVATGDTYSATQGQVLSVASPGVLANDYDPNGYKLTAIKVTDPANGTLTLAANGSFVYSPNAAFVGTDSFTYKANNGYNDSNTVTVTIAVNSGPPLSQVGTWSAPVTWPIVAINSVLMRTGQVLVFEDSGISARVWDPGSGTFVAVPNNVTDLFCSGHSALADGRILVMGGHGVDYNTDIGSADANIFDPITMQWTSAARMAYRRWYGTSTTLPDGRVLALSGNDTNATSYVRTPEIYNPSTNAWTLFTAANLQLPIYPHMFVLPNGKLVYTGNFEGDSYQGPLSGSRDTRTLDLTSGTWTTVVPTTIDGDSVMYAPGKILRAGSSNAGCFNNGASVATAYVIDMTQPSPAWQQTASMSAPRTNHNLTVLPDGSVIAIGGGRMKNGCENSLPVYEAEIWSPSTMTWSTVSAMLTPRLYHSTAVLLPDGRVLVAGGGRNQAAPNELSAEIYSPPYLFKGARPSITSAPGSTTYGSSFSVSTPNASTIASVALMRPGATTHSFDEDQRFLTLSFQQAGGGITVQAPANANLAPPGYYMLFLINQSGVPSVASFIKVQ